MLTRPNVILTLKIAVGAVTILLCASLLALLSGKYRLHGRINIIFFTLTMVAVLGLELIVRVIDPEVFSYFSDEQRRNLLIHLCFSVPSAVVLPAMLFTGLRHRRRLHVSVAMVFGVLWIGTFITGIFFL